MKLFIAVVASVALLAAWIWYRWIRVPPCLRGLPVVPPFWAKPSHRFKVARELSKEHAFARTWVLGWALMVLHPEPSKTLYTNQTLFEKMPRGSTPFWSFSRKFFGDSNVVFSQTEQWKRHRSVINPAFEFSYIRAFTSVFAEVADTLLQHLAQFTPSMPVNIHDWLQRYTLDALGKTAFGFDFQSIKDPENVFASTYHRIFDGKKGGVSAPYRLVVPYNLYDLLPVERNRQMRRDLKARDGLLDEMAKQGKPADSDLAAHLVKSTEPGATHSLSWDEVRSDLSIFFIAGHETSAVSVAATLWFLARYQETQAKVYEEIVRVCGKRDPPTFEGQKELDQLTRVIYEVNRLVPPVMVLPPRYTMEDTELQGLKISKGTLVVVSIDTIQKLEREWPNPLEFDPDRFAPEKTRHPFSWQPFGGGPRACLGRNFSVLEQKVVLVKILQAYRVCLPVGAPDTIQTRDAPGLVRVESTITLHPRESS